MRISYFLTGRNRVAITGHRPNKLWGYDLDHPEWISLGKKLRKKLEEIEPSHAISGMALGVDIIFALVALKMGIPLECAIPCTNQDALWPPESRRTYNYILERASVVTRVTNEPYTEGCMQLRNEYIVRNCNLLIAVWNGSPGGTKNCIEFAKKIGRKISYIHID